MSGSKSFFDVQQPHSKVKAEIVSKYFAAWAKIMIRQRSERINYIDLFSGRGVYKDGSRSTPLLVLDGIGEWPALAEQTKLSFYEGYTEWYEKLKDSIEKHPIFKSLRQEPVVHKTEINEHIVSELRVDGPSFTFIDPFGPKGVSLNLLNAVLRKWGCDCVFYLSIAGIRRNVEREDLVSGLEGLLGNGAMERLKKGLTTPSTTMTFDQAVFLEMRQSLSALGIDYILPFAVEAQHKRVSHFLVFASKHPLGFKIMKGIMGGYSQKDGDDFPSYLWTGLPLQMELPFDSSPMIKLAESLSTNYLRKTYNVGEFIVECHKRGCVYRETDIKKSLLWLESEGRLHVDKKPEEGRKRQGKLTLGDKRTIKFQ